MTHSPHRDADLPGNLLANRNFLFLWAAYAISAMGDHLSEMAILKIAGGLEKDVTPLAARISFVFFLPFLFGPFMGYLADLIPRRVLMITADVVRAVLILFFIEMAAGAALFSPTWGPFLPLLAVGLFAALFSPARLALLPSLIRRDQLTRANGMISGMGIIATMIGIALSGWIVDHFGSRPAFIADAGTYLFSALMVVMIAVPAIRSDHPIDDLNQAERDPTASRLAAGHAPSPWRGFQYARTHRRILQLVVASATVWFCGSLINSIIPAVVRDVYQGVGYTPISLYRALIGLGFVLGAIIIVRWGHRLPGDLYIVFGLGGVSAGMFIFALSILAPFSAGAAAVSGGIGLLLSATSAAVVMASYNALLQRIVPSRFRGRVFGVVDLCSMGALLLATGSLAVPNWSNADRFVGPIVLGVAVLAGFIAWEGLKRHLSRSSLSRFYALVNLMGSFMISRFLWRLETVGRCTVPRQGPAIVVANHTCYADPLLILGACYPTTFGYFVAAEYATQRFNRFFLNIVRCIPVRRDGLDTAGAKQAIRRLRDGEALGVFIQGRIILDGEAPDAHLRDGAAMLALSTGAPVIPIKITGTRYYPNMILNLLMPHRARLYFGSPVDLSRFQGRGKSREVLQELTRHLYDVIQGLDRAGADLSQPAALECADAESAAQGHTGCATAL